MASEATPSLASLCASGEAAHVAARLQAAEGLPDNWQMSPSASEPPPLHCAALAGHADVIRVLLAHGAAPGTRDAGHAHRTAAHCAALRGHAECLEVLLDADAALVSVRDRDWER